MRLNDAKTGKRMDVFHKAGFTYRNLVGRWLAATENKRYMQRKRREINPALQQKEYGQFVRTPFHTPCLFRLVCYTFFGVLSGGNEAPFTQGSLWFVRLESPSTFPDKHCFCGHKSSFYVNVNSNCIIKKYAFN